MSEEISIRSKVRHKAGGPDMIVSHRPNGLGFNMVEQGNAVWCRYWHGERFQEKWFHPYELETV